MTVTSPRPAIDASPAAPPASRARARTWRSPRLLLGVLLVTASVVVGARLLAAADDSVTVWAVARDLPAGADLVGGTLEARRVRFGETDTAARYLAAAPLPAGSTVDRALAAGELLPRSAVAARGEVSLVEVPVSVAGDDLPATVRQGSTVDVWVTPRVATTTGEQVEATRVLSGVVVVALGGAADSLAPQTTRQVIVGVEPDRADGLGAALGRLADGRVVVARRG